MAVAVVHLAIRADRCAQVSFFRLFLVSFPKKKEKHVLLEERYFLPTLPFHPSCSGSSVGPLRTKCGGWEGCVYFGVFVSGGGGGFFFSLTAVLPLISIIWDTHLQSKGAMLVLFFFSFFFFFLPFFFTYIYLHYFFNSVGWLLFFGGGGMGIIHTYIFTFLSQTHLPLFFFVSFCIPF